MENQPSKPWWRDLLRVTGAVLGGAAILLLTLALALFALLNLTLPPPTEPITIPSPSKTAAAVKQYGPIDEAEYLDVNVLAGGHSYPLLSSIHNPHGVIGDEGVTIGWHGEHQLTIGWPFGAAPISGPKNVAGIDVSYRAYPPYYKAAASTRQLTLHNTTVSFREVVKQERGHREDGSPVQKIECIIEIRGKDGEVFDSATASYVGTNPFTVKFAVTPLQDGRSPDLTPTQAVLADVFPVNTLVSAAAPLQDAWSLEYRGVTKDEALQIYSRLRAGNAKLVIGLNFGEQVLSYNLDAVIDDKIVGEFNACAATTWIYGSDFALPR